MPRPRVPSCPLVPVCPHRWPSLVASPHSCRRPQTQGSAGRSRCGRGPSSHPATGRGPRGHADAVHGPLRTRPQSGIEGGPTNSAPGQPPRWEQPQGREDARSGLASGSRARPANPARACTPAPSAASEKPGNKSAEETRFAFSRSRKVQVLFILQNPEVPLSRKPPRSTRVCGEPWSGAAGGAWGRCRASAASARPAPLGGQTRQASGAAVMQPPNAGAFHGRVYCRVPSCRADAVACKRCSVFQRFGRYDRAQREGASCRCRTDGSSRPRAETQLPCAELTATSS